MRNKKTVFSLILSALLMVSLFVVSGCNQEKDSSKEIIDIKISLEDGREIKAELYPEIAPITVNNFVKLINEDFYDGLIFHRVIEGFMIQGGGYDSKFYNGDFNQKEADEIKGEFSGNSVRNDLKHTRGVLSMARTSAPNSASSQFFIMHQDTPSLDGQYAAFGKVTEGIEIVDEIAATPKIEIEGFVTFEGQDYKQTMQDVPAEPIVIKTIEIVEETVE